MESSAQRLLVVEDDVAVARALSRTLARRGFSVAICRSCTAARTLSQTFDFAVLDLDLPDGNGVDLARDLMTAGKVPSVLFFTGSCDNAMLARARRMGTVVMKAEGTNPILAFLTAAAAIAPVASEHSEPPQSQTTPSAKARTTRSSSSSSLRRQRAR
ncbi:MAG: response regulator [Polyangiaceae bacterium]